MRECVCVCVCGLPIYYLDLSITPERSQIRGHGLIIGTVVDMVVAPSQSGTCLRRIFFYRALSSALLLYVLPSLVDFHFFCFHFFCFAYKYSHHRRAFHAVKIGRIRWVVGR